ncbi:NADH-FMN oxidoreductase RutF, flavin reductase (DIM6/NTAB) family [Actinacidiphila paucisporea]|uniref:NADH-FMN oxidoreductase RutF, flavin reductase (DIM6/NTAB) family n=2 Tax=Actinacidiphila paucisporea TaxID=310782 RepID=A0A1M7G8P5_9ACTN|nr:NADH-FMN oxidoreductase RutF, flavin reductase (DIM6/NTAB) family [Actinacidiphila paucisporea]
MTQQPIPDIRPLMSAFPTGVSVITSLAPDGVPWGMTCTSLCSVALDPPTLLVCLRRGSPTLQAVLDSGAYTINLLHQAARSTAELFASGATDRFERTRWAMQDPACGPHLVEAAHTIADCRVADVHEIGDHAVVMGAAVAVTQLSSQWPLLYGMRRYGAWAESGQDVHLSYDFIS